MSKFEAIILVLGIALTSWVVISLTQGEWNPRDWPKSTYLVRFEVGRTRIVGGVFIRNLRVTRGGGLTVAPLWWPPFCPPIGMFEGTVRASVEMPDGTSKLLLEDAIQLCRGNVIPKSAKFVADGPGSYRIDIRIVDQEGRLVTRKSEIFQLMGE